MIFKLEYLVDGQRMEQPFDRPQIVIGRDQSVDFVLNDKTVSRQHAVITVDQAGARLTVLSRGGMTAVNGRQVSGEVLLTDGCQLHFGQMAFTYRAVHAVAQAAPAWNPVVPQQPATPEPPPPKEEPKPELVAENTGGIRSWDDIAAGADEEEEDDFDQPDDIASNFQKLQRASEKADQNSKGTSPVVVAIGALLAIGMLVFSFYPKDKKAVAVAKTTGEVAVIDWKDGDIVCTVPADCKAKAIRLYQVSIETFEKREVDIVNLYTSYKNMDQAEKLLERGEITEEVPEMKGIAELKGKALAIMERKFVVARQDFHRHSQRNENRKMGEVLTEIQKYFPDKRCKYYRWANIQERAMRDKGIYLQTAQQ